MWVAVEDGLLYAVGPFLSTPTIALQTVARLEQAYHLKFTVVPFKPAGGVKSQDVAGQDTTSEGGYFPGQYL